MTAEHVRLVEAREQKAPWKKWGPYLSERQWGTVREDYSENGDAWNFFTHDHARSRAYRWGEDGLGGVSDKQRLCFALALWNGKDPILKERLFGLTNREGNHGEDVKEYYFYLDSTPAHSYMKYLYKYPQAAFPYGDLAETNRRRNRNEFESGWFHMVNEDIISMPDKWEYSWYAAWDLAFHTLPLSIVDPDFAKQQMQLMLKNVYLHPSGQMPAYEWNFSDVNPPVHAFATLFLHRTEQALRGEMDLDFLRTTFNKLVLNFTGWVNRKDRFSKNVFEGGFLGLDNISVFDRSAPLPTGGNLEQADGTARMALFSQSMLGLALELAVHDRNYEDMVLKFVEHFYYIAVALVNPDRLRRILTKMLDEQEFLSPYGIRALSKFHEQHPYVFHVGGQEHRVGYLPGESDSGMFGGNSNWRGPIWMPVNTMIIRALLNFHLYYGDNFKIECPSGSGKMMNLFEVAKEIADRLTRIFLRNEHGKRPVYGGTEKFQADPHWRDHILFYEYFHGDNGAGLGASHQTGWTGIVAKLIQLFGLLDAQKALEGGKAAAFIRGKSEK